MLKVKIGKILAETIQESLNKAINRENHRLAKSINNIYIVDNVEIPTCIVECGFLSNQEELNLLIQDDYQDKLAWGIFTGITEYFSK